MKGLYGLLGFGHINGSLVSYACLIWGSDDINEVYICIVAYIPQGSHSQLAISPGRVWEWLGDGSCVAGLLDNRACDPGGHYWNYSPVLPLEIKSLELIWISGTVRFHLWVPNLQMRCRDLTSLTHLPWTKCPPFHRRHFQMHFLEWKHVDLSKKITDVYSQWTS